MTGLLPDIPCTVLLVDDEENILRAITRLIMAEEVDLEVLSASSGAQGLEILKTHSDVALILSDQRMPGMSGAEFLKKARELAPDAVRMVLTGYADMTATMDAINKGGASRYLLKPWDDDLLRRTVHEGVGQYRLLQQNRQLTALVERQNAELSEWNGSLKSRVLEQTATIRCQNEELKSWNQRIGGAFRQTIVAFSRLIELHSSRLQEHTGNVTELSVAVARDLGLEPDQIETVRTAALLHEVGVIGIAPEILNKRATAMTREELTIFLQHAVRGQTAVDEVEELRGAGVLIRHHHERYGGGGFPDGLCGADIPIGSRIIAFADWIDRELEEERGEAAVRTVLAKAGKELGRGLDPALFPLIEPHVNALYLPARSQLAEAAEKELRPNQLLAGMRVTRNLYSGAGQLILTKGTLLDADKIATVVHQYVIASPPGGIYVSWKASEPGIRPTPGPAESLEMELRPKQLLEGMRITRNLYSGTGLLLLNEGTLLDAGKIVSVTRYYEIDPPSSGIFVIKKEA
jgi:response regulator RpfG family c-di-GMP phosphodiesterase